MDQQFQRVVQAEDFSSITDAGLVLDENALAALDEAGRSSGFDSELLQTTPAQDMRSKITELVALLKATDHQKYLKKQSWLARFTGADVEARLRLELANQTVATKAEELRRSVHHGMHIHDLLCNAEDEIKAHQELLEIAIRDAHYLLANVQDTDDFIQSRFERRLSNVMAINVANVLTLEQIALSKQILKTLIDRFLDVDSTLFPLWQRAVLALAHAPTWEQKAAEADLTTSQDDLIKTLQQE